MGTFISWKKVRAAPSGKRAIGRRLMPHWRGDFASVHSDEVLLWRPPPPARSRQPVRPLPHLWPKTGDQFNPHTEPGLGAARRRSATLDRGPQPDPASLPESAVTQDSNEPVWRGLSSARRLRRLRVAGGDRSGRHGRRVRRPPERSKPDRCPRDDPAGQLASDEEVYAFARRRSRQVGPPSQHRPHLSGRRAARPQQLLLRMKLIEVAALFVG